MKLGRSQTLGMLARGKQMDGEVGSDMGVLALLDAFVRGVEQ